MTDIVITAKDAVVSRRSAGTIGGPPTKSTPDGDELNAARIAHATSKGWPRVEIAGQHRRYLLDAEGRAYRLRSGLTWAPGATRADFVHPNEAPPWAVVDGQIVVLDETKIVIPPPESLTVPAKRRRSLRKS